MRRIILSQREIGVCGKIFIAGIYWNFENFHDKDGDNNAF